MRKLLLMVLAIGALATGAEAQRGGAGRGADSLRRPPGDMDRRIQERMGQILRDQLRLTDAQVRQMQEHNVRFASRRMSLGWNERSARQSLRDAMRARDSADRADVGALLERVIVLQRERLTLVEEEQRALAVFLTPMQRARYFAFEEELVRRSEELRRQAESHGGAARGSTGGDDHRRPPPSQGRRIPPAGLMP